MCMYVTGDYTIYEGVVVYFFQAILTLVVALKAQAHEIAPIKSSGIPYNKSL